MTLSPCWNSGPCTLNVRKKHHHARDHPGNLLQEENRQKLEELSGELEKHRLFNLQSIALSGKAMVSVKDILEAAEPYEDLSGVYFLVRGAIVVYVGQSVSIHVRIRTHISDGRIFDRVAYIKCPPEKLDLLESLYIHHINPEENGNSQHGGKHAPLSFIQIGKALLSMDNSNSVRRISNEKGRVKCAD
jgi:hypothetical protein